MQKIRVLLAEEQALVREALRHLLSQYPDIVVVAEAANAREAIKGARELSPDVVVLDVGMRGIDGIDATRSIALQGLPVVALAPQSDSYTARRTLSAGAAGYVTKAVKAMQLIKAIRSVASGKTFHKSALAALSNGGNGNGRHSTLTSNRLSDRELQVLELLADGHSTKEVAVELKVSAKTAETHRRSLMKKLNMRSIARLTKYAIREGITSLQG